MNRLTGPLGSIRLWQIVVLVIVLIVAGAATFAVFQSVTGPESIVLEEDQQVVPIQRGDLVNQISISGTLSLPDREALRFGTRGTVEEALIEEGQRVAEGDVLASLDQDTIASLDKGIVQAQVDLRDAQDALEDYLEPPTALDIAQAEQKVVTAELTLHNAAEAVESLTKPEQLKVAEANANVANALLALESALEKLDDLQEPPTELQRAEAQAKVAGARLALQTAEEALETAMEPTDSLQIAQAEAKVTSAQLALQAARETLETTLEPATGLKVTQVKARIAAAELALQKAEAEEDEYSESATSRIAQTLAQVAAAELALHNATEALWDTESGASAEDIANASIALETAEDELGNSQADLAVTESDWEKKASAAEENMQTAADSYSEMFTKWLGIEVDGMWTDPDYTAALAQLGVDLESVFDPSNIIPDLRADEASVPSNDTSTTWNEVIVFTWINLSPIPIAATCDPGDLPYSGVCVEEEFRVAADSYQAEMDSWASLQAEMSNSLTRARSAVHTAQAAQDKAREALVDLEEPAVPAVVSDLAAKVNLASAKLDEARETLVDFREYDPMVASDLEARANLAGSEMLAAWEDYYAIMEPNDATEIADQRAQVALAEQNLNEAMDDLKSLGDPVDKTEVANRRAQTALARQNLEQAEEDLESLDDPADDTEVAGQHAQIALARANVEDAESKLQEVMAGMEQPEYQAMLQDVEVARLDLEDKKRDLQELRANEREQVDRALLEANIASAGVALGQAQQRLADATMTAPWDGFVSQVNVEAGEEVDASQSIMVVVDTSVVEIDGAVDEIDVLQANVGAEATVTLDALPGQRIVGTVSFIAAEPEQGQGQGVVSYPMKVRISAPAGIDLPAGLSAVASITINEELGVLLAPLNALRGSFDAPTLSVVRGGEVVETPVTLGSSDDFWTVITDGVNEGDMVVMQAPDGSEVEFNVGGGPPPGERRGRWQGQ